MCVLVCVYVCVCVHTAAGVQGTEHVWELQPIAKQLPGPLAEKYPYLAGCAALKIPSDALDMVSVHTHTHTLTRARGRAARMHVRARACIDVHARARARGHTDIRT